MTLNAFIKQLQKLAAKGYGSRKVCIDVETFFDGDGTWRICDVAGVENEIVIQVDGDGFTEINKDGSERTVRCVVISGDHK